MRTIRIGATFLLASLALVGGSIGTAAAATSNPAPGKTAAPSVNVIAAAADYSSIFSGPDAALTGSGWTSCAAPIQWTVDTSGLGADQAAAQIANLTWALGKWSEVSGLTFAYAGTQSLTYDDASFSLDPADGSAPALHHIYLDFVADSASDRLSDTTVGLGSPTQVLASTKEIVAGDAVFRTDHVQRATTRQLRSLYLHELGHVLGLAHAAASANVMFPIVRANVNLGAGDINGVRAMTKACTA